MLFSELKKKKSWNLFCLSNEKYKKWIVFLMQPFFQPLFIRKLKYPPQKTPKARGSVVVDVVPVCESSGCSSSGSSAALCPTAGTPCHLQPQHSKPPS